MKHSAARIVLFFLLSALLLMGCDNSPAGIATLAPTAVVGTESLPTTPAPAGDETDENPPAPEVSPTVSPEGDGAATSVAATQVAYAAIIAAPPTVMPTPTEAVTPTPAPPPIYSYNVVNTFPHDPAAFTQGLVYADGGLYEGTGRWGESTIREVALESGTVLRSRPLDAEHFGEGITLFEDKIYQLTWQSQTGFVYNQATFEPVQTFTYPHEGWGITHDGTRLIVSDGTSTIRFWDPVTFQETGRITVRDHEGPINRLNELEYVDGEIWANLWMTDLIARIAPETGDVVGYIDLTGLLDTSTLTQPADVLNGIAYDAATGRIFVTGKLWPSLFEIEIVQP